MVDDVVGGRGGGGGLGLAVSVSHSRNFVSLLVNKVNGERETKGSQVLMAFLCPKIEREEWRLRGTFSLAYSLTN